MGTSMRSAPQPSRRPEAFAFALFCALAFACGCQKTASERLVGKWHGIKAEGVVPEAQQAANEAATGIDVEFKKDVVMIKPARDRDPMTSPYVVLKEDRRSVIVVTEHDGARDEQTLTLDTDDLMRWQVLPGKTVTVERVGGDKAKGAASASASTP